MFPGMDPLGIVVYSVVALASLPVLALALVRISASKAEATLTESPYAGQKVRRWGVVAIASVAVFLVAGALALAAYAACVGEC